MTQIVVACMHSATELLVVRKNIEDAAWRLPRLVFEKNTVVSEANVAMAARTHFGFQGDAHYWRFTKPVSLPSREYGCSRGILFTAHVSADILEDVFETCGIYEIRLLAYRGLTRVLPPKEAFFVQPILPF